MDPLLTVARAVCQRAKTYDDLPPLRPGDQWLRILDRFHRCAFESCNTAAEIIAFATENNGFVIYRRLDNPLTPSIIDSYMRWLEHQGAPLHSFGPTIQENSFAGNAVVTLREGRRISTSFLWHLCAATRLIRHVGRARRVLEIGPGFGGLARLLKLLWPDATFCLVDLPESLIFAYVYLSLAFPTARIVFADSPDAVAAAEEYDFLLVPTAFLESLAGRQFDLAINIASLGEMTQAAVDRYMQFLQSDLTVDFLYSINQFGHFSPERTAGTGRRLEGNDLCREALRLDRHWQLREWDLHGENGFVQIDPLMAPMLEVLLRRWPAAMQDNADDRIAGDLMAAAAGRVDRDGSWHRMMWEAARLDSSGAAAAAYRAAAADLGWPEFR